MYYQSDKPWEEWPLHRQLVTTAYEVCKDAYGYKPDWDILESSSIESLQARIDRACQFIAEENQSLRNQKRGFGYIHDEWLKDTLDTYIEYGAGDEATAKRWLRNAVKQRRSY